MRIMMDFKKPVSGASGLMPWLKSLLNRVLAIGEKPEKPVEILDKHRRLLAILDERHDIVTLEHGYKYLWIGSGAIDADDLRFIADELDRRNKAWHEQVSNDPLVTGSCHSWSWRPKVD